MKRVFLNSQLKIEDVVAEVRRVLAAYEGMTDSRALRHDVGEYLYGANVAAKRKRGSGEYASPFYLLATKQNGILTQKAYAWMDVYNLKAEADRFNRTGINYYVAVQLEQLWSQRMALLDELAALEVDERILKEMRQVVTSEQG